MKKTNKEKTDTIDKRTDLMIILMLALFNFCFLGMVYFFGNTMGTWCDSAGVVINQNVILGASVFGYLSYWKISESLRKISTKTVAIVMTCACIAFQVVIAVNRSYVSTHVAGVFCFAIMGIAGSAACYYASVKVKHAANMAKIVGGSYGLGILLQFVNNNCIGGIYEIVMIAICTALFGALIIIIKKSDISDQHTENNNRKLSAWKHVKAPVVALIGCVALMTVVFSTLDNVVTLVHASGGFDIGQWPRLILAASGIAAGVLYDIHGRKYMPVIMYLITILSAISIVIIQLGGSFVIGLIAFYIAAGFFTVFFMTGFMDISDYTKKPKLFAGLGRAVNNLFACIMTGISVKMIAANNQMVMMIAALVLFVLIAVCVLIYYRAFIDAEHAEQLQKALTEYSEKQKEKKDTDKFPEFVSVYKLTPREADVLKKLIADSEAVTDISKNLAISRATLYRHIAKINEKTNTDSRKTLVQYYRNWNG